MAYTRDFFVEYLWARLVHEVVRYFGHDNRRIEYALRMRYHADTLLEPGASGDRDIVIATAILHDIGIRISEEKLAHNMGKTLEEFGSPEAERLLRAVEFP